MHIQSKFTLNNLLRPGSSYAHICRSEFVCFQISVLVMSNAALEELHGPEVEEFLDLQASRVADAHRQAKKKQLC